MQRDSRTTSNQANRSTPAQANRAGSGQSRAASPQATRTVSQAGGTGSQSNTAKNVNAVVCRKCKSQQVVANKRGYSFANMFKTLVIMILIGVLAVGLTSLALTYSVGDVPRAFLEIFVALGGIAFFLALPVSILVGLVGRSEIINGCMNCGFKWRPSKKK